MFAEITDRQEASIKFGYRLKEVLRDRGQHDIDSAQRLSMVTGISKSYISSLLNGQKIPSLEFVFKLAEALNQYGPDMVRGLELFIKPRGYQPSYNSIEDENNYYYIVEDEWLQFKSRKKDRGISGDYDTNVSLDMNPEFVMYDRSMEAVGIPKNSIIRYKEINGYIENSKVYIIRHNSKVYPRRLFKIEDGFILVPCELNLDFDIVQVKDYDIEILGVPIEVKYKVKL